MIGYHGDDIDVEGSVVCTEQQIVEAVTVLARHDQDTMLGCGMKHPPLHSKSLCQINEIGTQPVQFDYGAVRRLELEPDEELLGVAVDELLTLDDRAVVHEQEFSQRENDSGPVGTRQREHEPRWCVHVVQSWAWRVHGCPFRRLPRRQTARPGCS